MHDKLVSTAAGLSDAELLRRVALLAGRERETTVELIAHLAELEVRKLHLAQGYGSLFAYCTGALRLAEHAAFNRIEVARLSRRFPAILGLLADGSLNLSTVRLLAPHLRHDNFEALVAEARGKSKRQVEELAARLAPRPDLTASVRRLPERAQTLAVLEPTLPGSLPAGESKAGPLAAATERPPHRLSVAPLSPERYRVQFTVAATTHEKLRRAQELLRRETPDGDAGVIFDRALTLLLDEVARKKLALVARPRGARGTRAGSRHIPASVKRSVWLRDVGRCAFEAKGRRCAERVFLEFHHHEPYAIGGETTVGNVSLRCRAHNVYEAELAFGPGVNSPRGELRPGPATPGSG